MRAAKLLTLVGVALTALILLFFVGSEIASRRLAPALRESQGRTKGFLARSRMMSLSEQVALFHLDTGRYPSEEQGLKALLGRPAGAGPEDLIDPWGYPFQYHLIGNGYRITCLGADGLPGGTGEDADIASDDQDNK